MTLITREQRGPLRVLLAVATAGLVVIVLPFYGTLLWAFIIALLFMPLQRRLARRLGQRPTVAAVLTMGMVLLIVVLPVTLVSVGLMNEVAALYEQLQSGEIDPGTWARRLYDSLPASLATQLERFGIFDGPSVQRRLLGLLNQAGQLIGGGLLRYGQNTLEWVVSLFIMLYVAFFLLRDGPALVSTLRESVPLPRRHQVQLTHQFSTVIRATVKGNLAVALLQGCLGGLAFWVLGVRGALVWAVLMAFLSLLPAVGAALVWAPVAVYLLIEGRLEAGLGLAAWGVLVIGLVDNLLRPVLVGRDTRLPDWVVLVSTLGGMSVFGINGFVIGPVIVAMFFAVWQIKRVDWARAAAEPDSSAEAAPDPVALPASLRPAQPQAGPAGAHAVDPPAPGAGADDRSPQRHPP